MQKTFNAQPCILTVLPLTVPDPLVGLVVDGIGEFARVDAALALHPADLPAGILSGLQRHAVAAAARGDGGSIALSGFPIADDWLVGKAALALKTSAATRMVTRIISFLPPRFSGAGAEIEVKLSSANAKVNTPCECEFPGFSAPSSTEK